MTERDEDPDELRPGQLIESREYTVDEVDLFLFSAACWLPHRIHFDQDFARSEGLRTVPLHGPLQAAWLVQLASDWASRYGARLVSSTVRHVSPAYPRDVLRASVTVESVTEQEGGTAIKVALQLARADGGLTTTGTATLVAGSAA
jgi:3-methylfumaryl-CoA hydratase